MPNCHRKAVFLSSGARDRSIPALTRHAAVVYCHRVQTAPADPSPQMAWPSTARLSLPAGAGAEADLDA